jgi:predicted DNA-binding transcriptional regulator AlpA
MRPEDSGTGSASALHGGEAMYQSDGLLTEKQAAAHLTLSVASLRRYRQVGGGPAYIQLSAGRVAYDPADIRTWRAARRVTNTAQGAAILEPR